MSALRTRLGKLEALARPGVCPEHRPAPLPTPIDWPRMLRPVSPDPAERAAYHAEMDALEAQPTCPRCGWTPEVIRIVACEGWRRSVAEGTATA